MEVPFRIISRSWIF